jgi:membrane-bound lytic murein transglycosylase B
MVRGSRGGRTIASLLALLWAASSAIAAPIPSRATDKAAPDVSHAGRAAVEVALARQEVADALAAHGLSAEEVEERVAQLSAEDLSALAANLDQIQAAGAVPNYIWILLAILIGVTILATVF